VEQPIVFDAEPEHGLDLATLLLRNIANRPAQPLPSPGVWRKWRWELGGIGHRTRWRPTTPGVAADVSRAGEPGPTADRSFHRLLAFNAEPGQCFDHCADGSSADRRVVDGQSVAEQRSPGAGRHPPPVVVAFGAKPAPVSTVGEQPTAVGPVGEQPHEVRFVHELAVALSVVGRPVASFGAEHEIVRRRPVVEKQQIRWVERLHAEAVTVGSSTFAV
jgi:hypothetical protein